MIAELHNLLFSLLFFSFLFFSFLFFSFYKAEMLRHLVSPTHDDWDELDMAEFAINDAWQESVQKTPFTLTYGQPPSTNFMLLGFPLASFVSNSGLPPQEAPVMITEKREFSFLFVGVKGVSLDQRCHHGASTAVVLLLSFLLSSCPASSCSACLPLPPARNPSPP